MGQDEAEVGSMLSRRAGGSENPIIQPLGLMLMALGFIAILFHRLKQSNIVACIIIGMVVGGTNLDAAIGRELADAFIELGIILVLFMGGLEVDVGAFIARWKLVLFNGLGQICLNLGFFCALGVISNTTSGAIDTIYFGLACTLSSTILVLGALKNRDENETVHGQIILGLMVLQDVMAVVSLAILDSLDPKKKGGSVGADIAIMFGKFIATLLILFFLSRFVLKKVFKAFAVSGEMLFIGTVGYAFGIASSCSWVGFSAEIGGFFAGVSIASLPYRLEIEHKVEPIKAFGVVLFFFMLGIDLHLTPESLAKAAPMAVTIGLLTVFILPSIMWVLGYASGLKSRTAFMMGIIINQISEFSLILAQLAHKYEVFTTTQYQIVTFGMLITLLFSSFGHVTADKIFDSIGWILAPLDRRSTMKDDAEDGFVFEDHVVLLGFNETGLEIAEYYRSLGKDLCVIQIDPALHSTLRKGFHKVGKSADDDYPAMSPMTMEAQSGLSRPVAQPVVMENGAAMPFNGTGMKGMSLNGAEKPMNGLGTMNGMHPTNNMTPRIPNSVHSIATLYGSSNGMNGTYGSSSGSSLYGSQRQAGPMVMGSGFGQNVPNAQGEEIESETVVGSAFGLDGTGPQSMTYHVPLASGQGPLPPPPAMVAQTGRVSGQFFIPNMPQSAPSKQQPDFFTRLPTERAAAGRASMEGSIKHMATSGHKFNDDGAGIGTNIFSLYADPESPESWEHYGLHKAKIVISCMVAGQEAEVRLSKELKHAGVPFLAITNSNSEAHELYEAGCRYVIQQEYLAAKVMHQLFKEEAQKGQGACFINQQRDHLMELDREAHNERLAAIQNFL